MEATALPSGSALRTPPLFVRKQAHTAPERSAADTSPRITIITVAYNSAATIAYTLESVARQDYGNIEHIVVDGGSTDATIHIIESFPHVARIISEKDRGIYDAMNKGLLVATGDIIGFLNSDDIYADDTVLTQVANRFIADKPDTLYGDLQYVNAADTSRVLRNWVSGRYRRNRFQFGWMPPHPTFFATKEVFQKVGGFNLSFKSAADYELMLRILFRHRFSASYLQGIMVKMRAGGASNGSLKKRLRANQEDRLAWKLNELRPYFFTLYMKPARKLVQYLNKEQLRRVPLLSALF